MAGRRVTPPDPDTGGSPLGDRPAIHPTARVRDSRFGRYCEVGARHDPGA